MKLRAGFFEVQHTYGMGDDPGSPPPGNGWSYERSVDS